MKPFRFSFNFLGIGLLMAAYAVSVVYVMHTEHVIHSKDNSHIRYVRITHWQLEPGYREALQTVIDSYNALPHVRQARIKVIQLPISEKVYYQTLNVHLISGTSPDLIEIGGTYLQGPSGITRFIEPLNSYANRPNPYNSAGKLPQKLDPELRHYLERAPWRETFLDGMSSSYNLQIKNYFGVPLSSIGGKRIFYNKKLMAQAKQLIRQGLGSTSRPGWLRRSLMDRESKCKGGTLPDSPSLRKWASTDAPPRTLGEFLLVCNALRNLSRTQHIAGLVPLAANRTSDDMLRNNYLPAFTGKLATRLDLNLDGLTDHLDVLYGLRHGQWDFETPEIRAYYECLRAITRQMPKGFSGIDREQSISRFVSQKAAMLTSGVWDAASLFEGASHAPEGEFEVGQMPIPMPGEGERWSGHLQGKAAEGEYSMGVQIGVYQKSLMKPWAIDFLQYITSFTVNQEFNNESGWISCIVGTEAKGRSQAFTPSIGGYSPRNGIDLRFSPMIATAYRGIFWNYLAGDISYETFVKEVLDAVENPRRGWRREWHQSIQRRQDQLRSRESLISVLWYRQALQPSPQQEQHLTRLISENALFENATRLIPLWESIHPDQPFPEF